MLNKLKPKLRCVICGKLIRFHEEWWGTGLIAGYNRHRRCGPGSRSWLKKYPSRSLSQSK
ncbi:MAG: hypothetical protein C4293_14110 [Nitrospiraceae bacterium]